MFLLKKINPQKMVLGMGFVFSGCLWGSASRVVLGDSGRGCLALRGAIPSIFLTLSESGVRGWVGCLWGRLLGR